MITRIICGDLNGSCVCGLQPGHKGSHTCFLDEHMTPSCGDGCCWGHDPATEKWANTPAMMLAAEWKIRTAEPGDRILLDVHHPLHRAHTVAWVGEQLVVLYHPGGGEVAYRHTDWQYVLVERPGITR